jgi:hypothetical protein
MRRLMHSRPSPALIVAVVALVAALAGTAVAEQATTSVSKKKTKRIANKQIDKRLSAIAEHSTTFVLPGNSFVARTVSCDADESVLSGGWRWNQAPLNTNHVVQLDHREGNGWRVGARNGTGSPKNFTVHAYCVST